MIRAKHPDYHPAIALADLAHDSEDEEIQFKCHSTLLKVIEPELKAMQIEQNIRETRTIRVSLFEEGETHLVKETESKFVPVMPTVMDAVIVEEVKHETD